MKTISLVGVTGLRNRGVEALVQPIVASFLAGSPDDAVNIYSWSPDYDERRISGTRVHWFRVGDFQPSLSCSERLAKRLGFSRPGQIKGWDELLKSNLVVFTGGDCLSAEYGDEPFHYHFVPLRLAADAGVPFVFFAQSIGPFSTANQRARWDEVSALAAHVSVRERQTYSYLADELKFPKDRLSLTADPAFVLETSAVGLNLAEKLRSRGRPLIGVSISQGIAAWTGVDASTRIGTWKYLVRRMLDDLKAQVVLIPHVQETYADDSAICNTLWGELDYDEHVTVLAGDFTAAVYKGVLARCNIVIAERMHAGIAALSSCVPAVLVAYSVKARGILHEMIGPDHAVGKALVEGADFGSPELVWQQLQEVWNDRGSIAERLRDSVPKAQALAVDGLRNLRTFLT